MQRESRTFTALLIRNASLSLTRRLLDDQPPRLISISDQPYTLRTAQACMLGRGAEITTYSAPYLYHKFGTGPFTTNTYHMLRLTNINSRPTPPFTHVGKRVDH
jgi:hypothetical protein